MPDESPRPAQEPVLDDFLVEPTRDLADWRWLWTGDHRFPVRSHRGFWGRLLVAAKRLLRPLVQVPQNDLWERQRTFNLILLEHLQRHEDRRYEERLGHVEGFLRQGVAEIMRHNDALFARVDQELDRHRRRVRDLTGSLGAALAAVEAGEGVEVLSRAREEDSYLELEQRYRGTEVEIAGRIGRYLPHLERACGGGGEVLDLGCGRGEALALLTERGIPARGVDASARMVALCRGRELTAVEGDLFEALAAEAPDSLAAVVSFHVVEHLPAVEVDRLVRLAYRALAPGGALILETPSPLSLVAGGRNFWLDPTHRRPVHPESLRLSYELAGFERVERLDLNPFPDPGRLPEIDLATLPEELHPLADRVNRLRDHLDELLYGCQDFAIVGTKSKV